MTVRFVLGRAGSGKTHYCVDGLRTRLRARAMDGPPLIFLVPEQASQQIERAVLLGPGNEGPTAILAASHRAEVFSFQRLAERVLESVPAPARTALTEPARIMVLRHLVARCGSQLKYYRSVQRRSGFYERLGATIAELIQEGVSPAALREVAAVDSAPRASRGAADASRRAKVLDLSLLYDEYLRFLGSTRLDPSQRLEVARQWFAHCAWIHGAELWVDGFASLSGQEAMTLVALVRLCARAEIAVLLDPSLALKAPVSAETRRLFARTLRTYQDLRRMLGEAGVVEEPPLLLNPPTSPRFRLAAPLGELERRLFGSEPAAAVEPEPSRRISLVELPSRRVEVDYAVSQVCEWTRGRPPRYRFRDIALIVRDLEPYHDLLGGALQARDIPFFLDRRRPISHHPLIEWVRAVVAAADSMSLESARLLLKTGLTPLGSAAGDELENYLLAHGIRGLESWSGADWSFRGLSGLTRVNRRLPQHEVDSAERVNRGRRQLFERLSPWVEFARHSGGHGGAAWADGLRTLLARMDVEASLRRWAEESELRGDLVEAEEHRQVWTELGAFLDDLGMALGDQTLTLDELSDVLDAGLGGLTLGLVPPTVDQVLVGSIERSRHPNIKAAIVLGFNDGAFPARPVEDAILNDEDREHLAMSRVRIGDPARRRQGDESMLAYIALTRAGEELVVTFARADEDGKALRPSPFAADLEKAAPALVKKCSGDPSRERQLWHIQSFGDVRRELAMEFRSRPDGDVDEPATRSRRNALYEAVRSRLRDDAVTRASWSSLGPSRAASLASASVERFFRGILRTSVSQLESYARCPFQYFANHVLRLKPREVADFEAMDLGTVHHAILEDFAGHVVAQNTGLAGLSEGHLVAGLRESCARVAASLAALEQRTHPKNRFKLRQSAARLARVLAVQRKALAADRMRPVAAELSFGMGEEGGLDALQVETPSGRRALLRGQIDRVDAAETADRLLAVVVDYKDTRNKRLVLGRIYHGLDLQLAAYLLAVVENGGAIPDQQGRSVRPAAVFFQSLASQYHKVDHPCDAPSRAAMQEGTFRARGLVDGALVDDLGITGEASKWADHYAIYRNKDGTMGRIDSSDAADSTSFNAMLELARTRIGELADGILDGAIDERPYRMGGDSPCKWCEMASVCRFELGLCQVRYLEQLRRSEVFRRLRDLTPTD